ncbi:MAG: redoxin family protein [Pseudomonadota bacterium]
MSRWLLAIPIVLLAGLAVLVGRQLADGERAGFERISRAAPTMTFQALDGGEAITFSEPRERAVAVNLYASWCAPCEAEHPLLTELSARAPGQVYGVLYKDSKANGADFLARLGDPFARKFHDPDGQGGLDFGLTGVPETFVIDTSGTITLHIRGVLTPDRVEDILVALAENQAS